MSPFLWKPHASQPRGGHQPRLLSQTHQHSYCSFATLSKATSGSYFTCIASVSPAINIRVMTALSRVAMRIKCSGLLVRWQPTKVKPRPQTFPGPTINMPTYPSSKPVFISLPRHSLSEMTALRLISTGCSDFGQSLRNRRNPRGYSCSLSPNKELVPERGRKI